MAESAPANPDANATTGSAAKTEARDLFKTGVAVLIAIVAVAGAWVTWRATVLASDAGAENAAGIAATLNVEETRTVNVIRLYQHYSAYTTFARYRDQGRQVDADWSRVTSLSFDEESAPKLSLYVGELERQRDDAFDMASAGQYFFPTRYLQQDGAYNTQRESGEASADAARQRDLNADRHFARADQLREQSNNQVGVVIVLTIALLLYTLAEGVRNRLKYACAGGGLLVMLGGFIAALMIGL